jgi:hypothetical protein
VSHSNGESSYVVSLEGIGSVTASRLPTTGTAKTVSARCSVSVGDDSGRLVNAPDVVSDPYVPAKREPTDESLASAVGR